jgi:putative aldouronate transport system substrate-binding protein
MVYNGYREVLHMINGFPINRKGYSMKKNKIISCLILIVIFGITCIGCKNQIKTGKSEVLYPEEEGTVITWYLRGEDDKLYENLKGIQQIEETTGIHIDFIVPPENSDDAYKLMIAAGNLPDVIQWTYDTYANGKGVNQLYTDGIAIELSQLIKDYAPNLMKIYEERPEILNEVETLDNKMFYFPSINPMLTEEERCRRAFAGLIVRKDWLDKVGMEIPNNIDEWYQMLVAFKNMDPNGNGLADEIPYDAVGLQYFLPAFGITNDFTVKSDGSVVYGLMGPDYKKYLETMHQWYLEGLIGQNCLVYSSKWFENNIINNIAGSFAGLDNAWSYYLPSIQEKDPGAELAAVPWLEAEDGRRYTIRPDMKTHIGREVTIITNQCKNPEAVVKLIDYFYSEKGSELLTWGIEGESFDVVDGRKIIKDEMLETLDTGYYRIYTYAMAHAGFPKYEGETAVLQCFPEEGLIAEKTWADCDTSLIYPPTLCFSVEDDHYANQYMTDINAYANEMQSKFITGEEPLSNYDNYVNNLISMKIEDVLKIYQKYYDELLVK